MDLFRILIFVIWLGQLPWKLYLQIELTHSWRYYCRPISLPLLLNIIYISLLYCLPCKASIWYFIGMWMAEKLLLSHCVNTAYITVILFQNLIRITLFYLFMVDLIIHGIGLYCIWKQLLRSDIKIVMYHANKIHNSTKTVLFVA